MSKDGYFNNRKPDSSDPRSPANRALRGQAAAQNTQPQTAPAQPAQPAQEPAQAYNGQDVEKAFVTHGRFTFSGKPKPASKRVHFLIPDHIYDIIKEEAQVHQTTMSEIIRQALTQIFQE